MKEDEILISIIVPTYNRKYCLERALRSIFNQTYKNKEIIVVDDGSMDGTEELIKDLRMEHPLIFVKLPFNRGVSHARNKGLEYCRSEWIAFLDSDDEWMVDKLKLQVNFIKTFPQYKLIHGDEIWMRGSKQIYPKKKHKKFGGDLFQRSLHLCLISPSTVLIKRNLLEEFSGWNENLRVCEDYDLWLKITSRYLVGFISKQIIVKHGGRDDQLSQRYIVMDYYRILSLYDLLKNHSLGEENKKQCILMINYRAEILLKGKSKHDDFKYHDEVHFIVNSLEDI